MPRTALGAAAPAALALLLGLWGITREDSMWRDEAATWQAAHRTAPEIWHLLAQVDVFTRCGNTEVRGRRVQAFERGTHCSDSPSGTRQFTGHENAPGR
ncbi:hypothetical protein SALBM135S_09824 [Streptomyces alboniger]